MFEVVTIRFLIKTGVDSYAFNQWLEKCEFDILTTAVREMTRTDKEMAIKVGIGTTADFEEEDK